ncbi:Maf family protein [Legionella yabuuchiae]|uniref:Maf family protein n=1 Tax=Legionella yabuuchiae TaxID=376727 RepID=UPI001055224D|nr:nucleoside triphosphate pyrophosphatase [Legionella yabuuchiae]
MSEFIHQDSLILASGSVYRQKLLKQTGLTFDVHPSTFDESVLKSAFQGKEYGELAVQLAQEKGLDVSQSFPETGVIAADQLCICEEILINKPITHERAQAQLNFLSGKTHHLLTAVCIAYQKKIVWQHLEVVALTMRTLSPTLIDRYLKLEKPYQSCGSYHFEGLGKWLFHHVSGDETTIIGLPVLPLLNGLIEQGLVRF